MTRRTSTPYGNEAVRAVHVAGAVDVSEPEAGYYRFKLGGKSIAGGVRLWCGPPHDPVTGEELDRSWRWQAEFNDEPIDFDRVWPNCAADRITGKEYRRYVARQEWARQHAPESAYAERGRRLDPLDPRNPLPF